jgi:L-cysteine desulfidase
VLALVLALADAEADAEEDVHGHAVRSNERFRSWGGTMGAGTGGRSGATGTTDTVGVICRGGHIGVTRERLVRGCTRPEMRL